MVSYLVAGQTDSNIYVCLSRREDGTIYKSIEISAEKRFITIAPDENVELYLGINVTQGNRNSTLRIAIYKGSYTADTLPAYEPYGYKVSGRSEGLNLLDVSDSVSMFNGDTVVDGDSITFTTTDFCYGIRFARLTLDPNTEYTLSYQSVNFDGNYTDSYGLRAVIDNSGVPGGASSYITFTTNETGNVTLAYYVGIPYEGEAGKILTIKGVALYKGSYTAETMPPYEPYQPPQDFAVYLPEQIAKVGDVADEVVVDMEKQTAELKKKYFRYDFTGYENWVYGKDYNRFSLNLKLGLQSKRNKTPSNRFETTNIPGDKDGLIFASANNIYVYHYDSTTKEEFNAFLADNPTYAYIPYSAPVTTDITSLQQWDAMPNIEGTVSITFDSTIPISSAETEYYSKEYDAT